MFISRNRAGRLLELRISHPVTLEEIDELQKQQLANVMRIPGRYVSVVDLRQSRVFPPDVAERLIGLMTRANPKLERGAFLLPESAILGLQAERAIQEVGSGERRVFRDPDELEVWLRDNLNELERQRLSRFLAGD